MFERFTDRARRVVVLVAEREGLPAIVGAERRPRRVARAELRGDVVERLVGGQGAASAYV